MTRKQVETALDILCRRDAFAPDWAIGELMAAWGVGSAYATWCVARLTAAGQLRAGRRGLLTVV